MSICTFKNVFIYHLTIANVVSINFLSLSKKNFLGAAAAAGIKEESLAKSNQNFLVEGALDLAPCFAKNTNKKQENMDTNVVLSSWSKWENGSLSEETRKLGEHGV